MDAMDQVLIRPKITLGISMHNKKTGASSGNKCITLSFCTTLLRIMVFLLLFCAAMKTVLCMMKMNFAKKEKKKLLKKWKRKMKK